MTVAVYNALQWSEGLLRAAAAQMEMHDSENALLDAFVEAVRALDPDILVGFEVQQGSLGFLADRATALERPDPLLRQLSRTPQVACCHMLCSWPMAARSHRMVLHRHSSPLYSCLEASRHSASQ